VFWKRLTWIAYNKNAGISGIGTVKGKWGRTRAAEGINVKMLYIINKDGKAIDGHQASKMRAYARFIWNNLSNSAKAPRKWVTGTPLTVVDSFRRQMQIRFPELRLCEGGWKVDQMGIDYYSSWHLAKIRKGTFNVEGAGHDDNEGDNDNDNNNNNEETKIEIEINEKENRTGSPSKSKHKASFVNIPAPRSARQLRLQPRNPTPRKQDPTSKSQITQFPLPHSK
jgi:hypothetical protein